MVENYQVNKFLLDLNQNFGKICYQVLQELPTEQIFLIEHFSFLNKKQLDTIDIYFTALLKKDKTSKQIYAQLNLNKNIYFDFYLFFIKDKNKKLYKKLSMPKENIEEAILFLKIQKKIIQNYKERE